MIFGAVVRPDGAPSASLARRIAYGLDAARAAPSAVVFCSGAAGRSGPSEAAVMRERLMAAGIASRRLLLDEASRDTLQTAVAAREVFERGGYERCVVCSDAYHLPRIRLLLAMLGVRSEAAAMAPSHGRPHWTHRMYMSLREAIAIPYDVAIVAWRRRPRLAGGR